MRQVWGVETTIDGVPWHGNTDIGILRAVAVREGIDPAVFDRDLRQALRLMTAEAVRHRERLTAETCAGVPELVAALHARGKLLGVASGNLEEIGWIKVAAAGLRDYFAFGAFSDEAELRRDIIASGIRQARERLGPAASVCVIGDTPSDISAARENGIPVIAVARGIYTAADLAKHAPDVCVGCCTDLLPLLQAA